MCVCVCKGEFTPRMITIKVTIMIFASTPIHDIVLFIISTPASLNACTLQSQVDSDWLSFFFFCSSAGKKIILNMIPTISLCRYHYGCCVVLFFLNLESLLLYRYYPWCELALRDSPLSLFSITSTVSPAFRLISEFSCRS